MGSFEFADLFAGIGGTRLGFERQGGQCVYTCEKDEDAREAYVENWGDEIEGHDIQDVNIGDIPNHDILLACWPCPSFSRIGNRTGLRDDRGSLFYYILEILERRQPQAFFLENVKAVKHINDGAVFNAITDALEDVGYTVEAEVLNALDFGLPQHRERLIMVGSRDDESVSIPTSTEQALTTSSEQRAGLMRLLEPEPSDRFTASESIQRDRRDAVENPDKIPSPSVWHENRGGKITPHPYASALRANASWNYQLIDGYRRFTPRELLRLQGFPDWFTLEGNVESRFRKLTGNSIPVPMVEAVAGELLETVTTLPSPETRPAMAAVSSD